MAAAAVAAVATAAAAEESRENCILTLNINGETITLRYQNQIQ